MKKLLIILFCVMFLSGCDFLDLDGNHDNNLEEENVIETPENLKVDIVFSGYAYSEPVFDLMISWDKVENCNGYYVELLDANTKKEVDMSSHRHIEGNDNTSIVMYVMNDDDSIVIEVNVYAVNMINHSTPELYHYEILEKSTPAKYYFQNRESMCFYTVGYFLYCDWEFDDAFEDVVNRHLRNLNGVTTNGVNGENKSEEYYKLNKIVRVLSTGSHLEDGYIENAGSASFNTMEMLLEVSKVRDNLFWDGGKYTLLSEEIIDYEYQIMSITRIDDTYANIDNYQSFYGGSLWDYIYGFQNCDVKIKKVKSIINKDEIDKQSAQKIYSVLMNEIAINCETEDKLINHQLKHLYNNGDNHVFHIDKYTFNRYIINDVYLLDYECEVVELSDSSDYTSNISFKLVYVIDDSETLSLDISLSYTGKEIDNLYSVGSLIESYYNDGDNISLYIKDLDYTYSNPFE